ncbi:MAG: transglycosylase domain-containing protein [Pseudomonadota bacterium]
MRSKPTPKTAPKTTPKAEAAAKTSKPKTRPGPGLVGRAVRAVVLASVALAFGFVWRVGLVAGLVVAGATAHYYTTLPEADALFDARAAGSVTLLDRQGSVFAWRGEQYGGDLRADDVSPHLIHAVIAAEDRRYWRHIGVDPRGIARALWTNLQAGRVVQGGSTLTQQVAKNVFLNAERSLERKIKEVPMALALELKYAKDEILSIYLNRVYLGAGTYGFEAAAQRYFGKSARGLTPAEAAMLAGLLRAPSRYAPTNDLDRAQGRASVIVGLMHEQGYLSEAQVYEALANPASLSRAAKARTGAHFADWVMETAPDYLTRTTTEDVVIETTFDARAQAAAEAGVERVFADKVKASSRAQAAVVVLDREGAVRAMVGGRDGGAGHFNRAAQAKRQTGSAFKAVVYAAGLEAGLSPQSTVQDAPLRIGSWTPENYDRRYRGTVTLAEALTRSLNTAAVRVSEQAGRERVRTLAQTMGIATPLAPGPAVALGTSEATLVDMSGVYATIAAGGRVTQPWAIRTLRLREDRTPLLSHASGGEVQALSAQNARRLTWMLHRVVEAGTGGRARLNGWQVAGKTGTTQAARDAWFIGFTSAYTIGVWMGNDDNKPLTGVTGGGLPADIFREVAARLHNGLTPAPLAMEAGAPPRQTPVVRAPAPRRIETAARREEGTGSDTLVERVFSDVLRNLGSSPTDGSAARDPRFGNDRD